MVTLQKQRRKSDRHFVSWSYNRPFCCLFKLTRGLGIVPTSLRLQNYPFIDDSDYINFVDAGETPRGIVDNKWNCLVFCEKCDNRRPPGKALIPYMGNLAMPKNPANGNSKAVCGTFAMDGRLFFNEYLLPELREFCIGSQIIPLRPKMYTDPNLSGTRACISSPVIACGVVPSNLSTEERKALTFIPPSSANNNYYDFAKTGPLSWEWHTKLTAPGSRSKVHYYGNGTPPGQPIYRKYTTESEMSVRVRGKPGSSVIAVEGGNEYRHWEGYYNNDSFDWNSRAGTDVVLWGKFAITSRWSVEINLSPEGETSHCGIVSPVIQGIDNNTWLPINMNVRVTDECYNISNSHKDMERDIYESMSRSLEVVNQTLQKKFQSAGRFIYPGVGTLSFGGMKLSESGNVYCDVDYIPPNPGPIKLLVPDSRFPYSKEFKRDSNARDIPGAPPSSGNIPRIKWTPAIKYDPITRRAKLTLIAQNALKQAAAFSNIKVILSQVKSLDSYGLFSEETWENKEDVLKRQEERRKKKEEEEERKKREQKGREKKTRERDNAKPSDARAVEDIKDDIGEHERKTVEETIIIEPESKPDKRPAAKSEPESESESEPGQETGSETEPELEPDEEPSQTWLLKYQGVFSAYVDRLYVKPDVVGQNHVILFSVLPDGEFPPTRKKRFIFSKDENASSFTLELEGKVRRPGKYVLQLSESWSVPNVMNNPTKTELSDSWFTVLIDETNRTGQFERVTQKEAEKIQGVKV